MIRTIIVEDEPLARDLLRSYLALHSDIDLVGEASDGRSGLALVNDLAPDLLLLDIQMPEMSGILMAQQLKHACSIIFITAHDAHALAAFELGAFDYLLKPVLPERFGLALNRVRERGAGARSTEPLGDRVKTVLHDGFLQRFFVRHLGTLLPVHVAEIVRLEADDDYTAIHVNGRRLMIHVPLRVMVERLDPQVFVRVHRCDIVNLAHVTSAIQQDRRTVLYMSDGSSVYASRAGTQVLHGFSSGLLKCRSPDQRPS